MASWYYDRSGGDDGTGTGLASAPYRTATALLTAKTPGAGDFVFGANQGKENISLNSYAGVTHVDWAGLLTDSDGSGVHLADFVSAGSWSVSSGATYVANIGAGLTIANVADRWATRVLADGRHYGWNAKGTVSAGALPAAGTWDYVDPNLYVRLSDGSNPGLLTGEDRVMFVRNSNTVVVVMQGAGTRWTGVGTQGVSAITPNVRVGQIRHCSASSGVQYCLIANGQGTVVEDLRLDGGEDHAMIVGSTGGVASEVLVEDVVSWGMGKTVSAASFTAYSGASGNVDGTVFRRCSANAYTLLDTAGVPLLFNQAWTPQGTPLDLQGFYHHTDGAGGRVVADVLVDECVVTGYGTSAATHNRVAPYNGGNTAALAGGLAYRTWDNYPVRMRRCKAFGCSMLPQAGNLAYKGCFLDLTKASLNTGDAFVCSINAGATVLFESCVILVNLQRGSSNRSAFHLYAGARLLVHCCTIVDVSTGGSWYHDMFSVASAAAYNGTNAGFSIEARANILAFANANTPGTVENRLVSGDSGAPSGNYVFSGNLYHNVSATQYSDDAARNTTAEWIAGVDTTGITTVNPGLASITSIADGVAGTLAASSALRLAVNRRVMAAQAGRPSDGYGYNSTPYNGTVGAYQINDGADQVREMMLQSIGYYDDED